MNDKEQKHKYSGEKKMLVSYGKMGLLGWFTHNEKSLPKANTRVMIKTERGLEIGRIVGRFCYRAGAFKKSENEVLEYYGQCQKDGPIGPGGKFVRYATGQDLSEERHINLGAEEELKKCACFIKEMNLPMKLVDIEHVFGGERIIFYFTAEDRVDFRDLVKRLAKEYQTRIEMRQVGSRDAAKIAADIETCGQPCCCGRFLKILKPVNMKMAKLQKATLDPTKISGYCGRLKCCLRYEDATYRELSRRLPRKKSLVKTQNGEGVVINTQLLTQLVSVRIKDGSVIAVPLEEIEALGAPETGAKRPAGTKSKKTKHGKRKEDYNNDKPEHGRDTEPRKENQ